MYWLYCYLTLIILEKSLLNGLDLKVTITFDFTLYVAGFASFLTATTILLTQNFTAMMIKIISVVGVALVLRMVDKPKLQDNGCIRSCCPNSGQRAWGFDSPTQHPTNLTQNHYPPS